MLCSTLFVSCAGVQKFREDTALARDKDKNSFVEKKDGTIIEAKDAVLRTPLFSKPVIELDGNTKIPTKEIEAYQNRDAYFRRVDGQFAPRIKKGLINMYVTTETYQEFTKSDVPSMKDRWRTRTHKVFHLQKGDSAAVVRFTPAVTESYVQDSPAAMDFIGVYEQNKKKYKTWSYINTAATFGGLALILASGNSSNNSIGATGYAGVGLFLGGFVNGFVNKIHKGKNYKNLELAIDAYNAPVTKKKKH